MSPCTGMRALEPSSRSGSRTGRLLTWRYVTDPICPFETPEGEPEEIDLRGVTGYYWAAEEEPEESDGSTITVNGEEVQVEGSSITVGDVTIITGGSPDTEETGTLIWTDPETNTAFFLEGALDRFDLRDMVTFMEETEPQFSTPVKGATVQQRNRRQRRRRRLLISTNSRLPFRGL